MGELGRRNVGRTVSLPLSFFEVLCKSGVKLVSSYVEKKEEMDEYLVSLTGGRSWKVVD